MSIDVHAYCGPWAFRHIPDVEPDALVRRLARAGIHRALVSATEAVLYKDPQQANRLLAERVQRQPERLLPVATLNPRLLGWEADWDWCLRMLAPVGLRLHPNYHGYSLASLEARALIAAAAAQLGLIIFVVNRLEDERVNHPLARVAPLPTEDIVAALCAAPEGHFVLCGLRLAEIMSLVAYAPDLTHYTVEISHLQHPLDALVRLREVLPADRIMLGSGAPLMMPEPAVYKVHMARLPEAEKQLILEGNVMRFLEQGR